MNALVKLSNSSLVGRTDLKWYKGGMNMRRRLWNSIKFTTFYAINPKRQTDLFLEYNKTLKRKIAKDQSSTYLQYDNSIDTKEIGENRQYHKQVQEIKRLWKTEVTTVPVIIGEISIKPKL